MDCIDERTLVQRSGSATELRKTVDSGRVWDTLSVFELDFIEGVESLNEVFREKDIFSFYLENHIFTLIITHKPLSNMTREYMKRSDTLL